MPVTKSPLRYPGGKTQLAAFIDHTIKENKIENAVYCEPFSGGAGAAIELLLTSKVKSIILNDFDKAIYSFWHAILTEKDRFIDKIKTVDINMQEWEAQRALYFEILEDNTTDYSFELGFAAFFLNRTNRSGIITGGPLGGFKGNTKYPLNCRFNKESLVEKITAIHSKKDCIELYNLDVTELIENVLLQKNDSSLFVFFDPPYYKQGKNLYKNFFNDADHVNLFNAINRLNAYHWITTYDNEDRIKEIYANLETREYSLQYSANKVRKEKELFFHSPRTLIKSYDKVRFI